MIRRADPADPSAGFVRQSNLGGAPHSQHHRHYTKEKPEMTSNTTSGKQEPRHFDDKAGRRWHLRVDVGRARKVRQELAIDLLSRDTESTILELANDPIDLVSILWILVEKQAGEAGIESDEFFESLTDDAIEAATFAFLHALIDFFPTPRQEALRRIVRKMRDVDDKKLAAVKAALDDGRVDRKIEHVLEQQLAELDDELAIPSSTLGK